MACIGLGLPRRMGETLLPGQPTDFGIGHVIADIRELFCLGIFCPQSLGTAKIRYSRFRRDARASKRHNAARLPYPFAHGGNIVVHRDYFKATRTTETRRR